MATMQIFGFWRSQATYRLRVAFNLKGIAYEEKPIALDKGEQFGEDFRKINPLGSVPALLVEATDGSDQEPLTQSLAILEYIEETHPATPLLPKDPLGRARIRSLASIAISDSHPLIVPRIRGYLQNNANFDAAQWKAWQTNWFNTALEGFEARLSKDRRTGQFCHGDQPTIADICLLGLIQGTRAFEIEVPKLPTVERIVEACEKLDAFERAKGVHQVDYPQKA
ncbi:Putative glutathione S-transferase, Thioredoxin-like superfamily, glutathione Transferase family [Septoria linicola]|uniref:Glutathione S-transferase, Thioredoxin-like superfamily, glutathione Transferase family n=1 Tax=Septoria linicola TaxID=215465 RepID=A0A9Q9AR66_9PEZI|nr:putative glutathione S-transferase, Thioredoxin-like superfamily, glutathione Transferase family [Septoria linicola]USW53049.1 Putative glutathione S-transferase, Thioredoxin-like superfamily, glutathione Transferase family [Septoria linicola]